MGSRVEDKIKERIYLLMQIKWDQKKFQLKCG